MREREPDGSVWVETDRLVLREFRRRDVDELYALHNDPAVMRYLTGGSPVSREEIEREFRERFLRYEYWAVEEHSSSDFLGWVGLHAAREPVAVELDPGTAWLGYRFHVRAWGKGYATEAGRVVVAAAFTERGVRQVRATTMAVNTASRRLMERLGLRYVRTYHEEWDDPLPGTEHGEVEYALSRAEWERSTRDAR